MRNLWKAVLGLVMAALPGCAADEPADAPGFVPQRLSDAPRFARQELSELPPADACAGVEDEGLCYGSYGEDCWSGKCSWHYCQWDEANRTCSGPEPDSSCASMQDESCSSVIINLCWWNCTPVPCTWDSEHGKCLGPG